LASAVLLSASGFDVTVYEAGAEIGGRTARVRVGEFAFDRGPTFFMMPYVLDEVFAAAGRRLRDEVELTRLDPMYRLVLGRVAGAAPSGTPGSESRGTRGTRDDLILDATQDVAEMSRRIGAIHARDGGAFARFIADNRYKLRHSESILRNPMRSPLDLFGKETWKDTLKVGPVLAPHLSVHQLLCKYFEDPHVRLAVSFQSKYLGMSPFECPSLFTILPFIEYEYGIWHPTGGCHALMVALARVAEECGARIACDAPVAGLEFGELATPTGEGARASGVRIERGPHAGVHRHDHVFVNADATWALKHLVPDSVRSVLGAGGAQYEPARLDAKKYSCSTAMLYLGVDGEVELPHHTIYVSASYEDNLRDICERGRLSADPSVYVCNPSRIDGSLAPKGKSSIYLLVPTPNCDAPIDWARAMAGLREHALDQVRDRMGVDLRGRIEREVVYTPETWRGQNINKGATFNLAHNLGQMLHLRPQNRLRGFDNVYLVGGGTHPGSGLPTIFLSAQISSRLVCERMGVAFAGNSERVREIALRREMQEVG
jgi:phytoene desaturase